MSDLMIFREKINRIDRVGFMLESKSNLYLMIKNKTKPSLFKDNLFR